MNRFRLATRVVLAALGLTAGLVAVPADAVAAQAPPAALAPVLAPVPAPAPPSLRPAPPVLLPAPVPAPPGGTANEQHPPCTGEFHGDTRLGPKWLPHGHASIAPLLRGYERTGGLPAAAFLAKYWQGPADSGGWKYPPNDGFAEVNGHLDKQRTEVTAGEELDRFGSENGAYLAPAGDDYAERALPPQSLNTFDSATPCNYHVYRVTRAFEVWQGGIAPWFGQPGHGEQIMLDPALLDPGAGRRLNVRWLLDNGYVEPATA